MSADVSTASVPDDDAAGEGHAAEVIEGDAAEIIDGIDVTAGIGDALSSIMGSNENSVSGDFEMDDDIAALLGDTDSLLANSERLTRPQEDGGGAAAIDEFFSQPAKMTSEGNNGGDGAAQTLLEDFIELSPQEAIRTGLLEDHRARIDAGTKILGARLRPDIPNKVALQVFATVILSKGLSFSERGSAHAVAQTTSGDCEVAIRIGVTTITKNRVLIVAVLRAPGKNFILSLFESLQMGLNSEALTMSALMNGIACPAMNTQTYDESAPNVLDVEYTAHLMDAFRREALPHLHNFAEPLEKQARDVEWGTAVYISAAKIAFEKFEMELPQLEPFASLENFEMDDLTLLSLTDDRFDFQSPPLPDIHELKIDRSRLSSMASRVLSEMEAELHIVRNKVQSECSARKKRKYMHTNGRVEHCKSHRSILFNMLRTASSALNHPDSQAYRDTFGDVGIVLMIAKCSMSSRIGRLFITPTTFAFHSSIMGFSNVKHVFRVQDIQSIEKTDGLIGGVVLHGTFGKVDLTIPVVKDRAYELMVEATNPKHA